MTVGRLAEYARRASIQIEPASPLVGAHAEYRRNDYHTASTQREAGIERHRWEDRIEPLRPWLYDAAVGVALVIFGISAFWAASGWSPILKGVFQ